MEIDLNKLLQGDFINKLKNDNTPEDTFTYTLKCKDQVLKFKDQFDSSTNSSESFLATLLEELLDSEKLHELEFKQLLIMKIEELDDQLNELSRALNLLKVQVNTKYVFSVLESEINNKLKLQAQLIELRRYLK